MSETPEPNYGPMLWIVGRDAADGWEFQGVYGNETDAAARCEDASWFVGPCQLGAHVPTARAGEWPGAYRPLVAAPPAGSDQP